MKIPSVSENWDRETLYYHAREFGFLLKFGSQAGCLL